MLETTPSKRATLQILHQHPWIKTAQITESKEEPLEIKEKQEIVPSPESSHSNLSIASLLASPLTLFSTPSFSSISLPSLSLPSTPTFSFHLPSFTLLKSRVPLDQATATPNLSDAETALTDPSDQATVMTDFSDQETGMSDSSDQAILKSDSSIRQHKPFIVTQM